MTQDDYKLWTGKDASNYTENEWAKLTAVAKARLASFLCLAKLPTDDDDNLPADLEELLAEFMAGVLDRAGGSTEVESKHVRNFTINFRESTAANAFAGIYQNYADIIEFYSNCDTVHVESRARYCCGRK